MAGRGGFTVEAAGGLSLAGTLAGGANWLGALAMNLIQWWIERGVIGRILCAVPFLPMSIPAFVHAEEVGGLHYLGVLPGLVGCVMIVAAFCIGRDDDWM